MLFTFPSRYYALSVTKSYLALGDGPPMFLPDSTCPAVLWIPAALTSAFAYETITLFGWPSHANSASLSRPFAGPNPTDIATCGLGSFPFARRYLGNRMLLSLPRGTKMFQFPRFPSIHYGFMYGYHGFAMVGSPIRISTVLRSLAAPRSFSQLAASFFGA